MATTLNSTTDLDRQLIALSDDLKAAARTADALDDDVLGFDIAILLHRARTAVQEARDLLDACPIGPRDAEPQAATNADGRAVVAY